MKGKVLKTILAVLFIVETLITIFVIHSAVRSICFAAACKGITLSARTVLAREVSPDGRYCVLIEENGLPDWPFGCDHLSIALYENSDDHPYSVRFDADVANDGCQADYEVQWQDDGVQIALMGKEQPTAYYVLPFKTLERANHGSGQNRFQNAVT